MVDWCAEEGNSKVKHMRMNQCVFEGTKGAARHNDKWLKHYRYDLMHATDKQGGTMLQPGSEF